MNCPKCGMNALPDETISAVGFAYCKSCGMLWSAWAHAEMDRLKQELATEREKVAEADQVIASFVRACITGQSDFAFSLLESYRAKYPKGGE